MDAERDRESGESGESATTDVPGRSDQEQARLNWQMQELLGELRIALPGVQVLFAFLLTVPFARGFERVDEFQKIVYLVALLAAAAASAFLIAPTAIHRISFRRGEKPFLLRTANGLTIVGVSFLALAIVGSVLLVTDYLFTTTLTIVVTAGAGLTFLGLWYVFPIGRRLAQPEQARD